MNKLTDEQNMAFMNDPRRVKARERLDKALKHIEEIKTLSAQVILTIMPPALKELETAYNELIITETQVECEILNGK